MNIGLIGINRYAKFLNFACNLHAYAFQQFLAQNGYDSTFIDYKPVNYGKNFSLKHPAADAEEKYRRALLRNPVTREERLQKKKDLVKWANLAMGYRSATVERERRYEKFENFIADHLKFTDEKYDSDLLEIQDPGFDTYICVTDVIWQPIPTYTFDRGFFLGSKAFEGKQKISYAASRGASKGLTDAESEMFFNYLSDIDSISVREHDFREYIESNSDLSAPVVADPTLLHGKEFWQNVSKKPSEERYVLLYYVMEQATDTIQKAVDYAKLHDLTLVELSDRPFRHGKVTDPDVKHVSRYDVGVDEWLGYIENAECVFTNSFHGCCFSLLFEIPFFAGPRNGQKVPNFLEMFGLSDRRFDGSVDVRDLSLEIDFERAQGVLAQEREQGTKFILTALQNAEAAIEAGHGKDVSKHERRRRELEFPVLFHSDYGGEVSGLSRSASSAGVEINGQDADWLEYKQPGVRYRNSGSSRIELKNQFVAPGYKFNGWTVRFRIDNDWFWYLKDGSIVQGDLQGRSLNEQKALIRTGEVLPHLSVNKVSVVVLTAKWSRDTSFVARAKRELRTPTRIPGRVLKKIKSIRSRGAATHSR